LRPNTGVELTVSSFNVEDDSVFVVSTMGTSVDDDLLRTEETFIVKEW